MEWSFSKPNEAYVSVKQVKPNGQLYHNQIIKHFKSDLSEIELLDWTL